MSSDTLKLEASRDTLQLKTATGIPGDAATVAVGTVTTLAAGSPATVVNAGTSNTASFNFGIPHGAIPATCFDFDTSTTDADPGDGDVKFNHATPASVTAIYFDNLDRDGNTVTSWLDAFDDSTATIRGTLTITQALSPSNKLIYNVTGTVVDGTGYRKVTVAHVAGTSLPAADTQLGFVFARTGNNGADGEVLGPGISVDGEVALFDGTDGGTVKRATGTGPAKLTSGVLSASAVNLTSEVTGNLPLANGGTGASLADPNADRIMFWDDSAGAVAFLGLGNGLTITDTTLSSSVLTTIATGSLSGTSTDIPNIPATYKSLILKIDSANFDATAVLEIHISTDNGSSFVSTGIRGFAVDASAALTNTPLDCVAIGVSQLSNQDNDGGVTITGYQGGPYMQSHFGFRNSTAGTANTGMTTYPVVFTAINALRITSTSGTASFDAGSYTLYGVG